MWWWRKVRKANIPDSHRDIFERYGEHVIGSILAGGFSPGAEELVDVYRPSEIQKDARDWLTEQRDLHERREQRLEIAEWAILIFVVLGVFIEVVRLVRELFSSQLN